MSRRIVVVSSFPTIQASSYAQQPSNALKFSGTAVCLPSDHVTQIHYGQCLSNQKTQPICITSRIPLNNT
jgi:hypothetical protein